MSQITACGLHAVFHAAANICCCQGTKLILLDFLASEFTFSKTTEKEMLHKCQESSIEQKGKSRKNKSCNQLNANTTTRYLALNNQRQSKLHESLSYERKFSFSARPPPRFRGKLIFFADLWQTKLEIESKQKIKKKLCLAFWPPKIFCIS